MKNPKIVVTDNRVQWLLKPFSVPNNNMEFYENAKFIYDKKREDIISE